MSLSLYVDETAGSHPRRARLHPGLVPVLKGNGYGFGLHRLVRKAAWPADTVAVGTYDEVEVTPCSRGRSSCSPRGGPSSSGSCTATGWCTPSRLEDPQALAARDDRPRVVLERMTLDAPARLLGPSSARPPGSLSPHPRAPWPR